MNFDFKTRQDWGARAPYRWQQASLSGPTTLHWNGSGTHWAAIEEGARYSWMAARLRAVQRDHMAPKGKRWRDIAYNFAVDPWGLAVWELRGLGQRSAANGTNIGNASSHTIYVPTGVGDLNVTDECLDVIDDCTSWIAEQVGAQDVLLGHRDWKATACPGKYLYSSLSDINEPDEEIVDTAVDEPIAPPLAGIVAVFELGDGYAVADEEGSVMAFGTDSLGDLSTYTLNAPIVDAEGTVSGKGYYLVGADGGVFTFGDAVFLGSMGDRELAAPVVAIEVMSDGYFMVAADGGIFTFGEADYLGRPETVWK